jgi:hypothetical protein
MVKIILMDMEFKKIIEEINMAIINMTGAREHSTYVKRGICMIKESARCTILELHRVNVMTPPKQVIIHLIYFMLMWMNVGPNEIGISQVYSPREIVTGKTLGYNLHCKANLGQYIHPHIDLNKTIGMQD